ncbi:MAG TPA: class I SAM-dependent methyltransferase [Candidatus Polarisedimenticolia bacterium]|nr:class I SAM-dependent methyltransferase [Candidatus Polarisedimenticolia bacterium]
MSERRLRRGSALLAAAAALAAILAPAHSHDQGGRSQTKPAEQHDHQRDHQATADHPFDDVEKWVRIFEAPERAAWQKPAEIPGALGVEPGMAVADIGAGTGYFGPHFSRAVGPEGVVYAVDLEPKMVAYMEERFRKEGLSNVRPQLGAADDPKLPQAGLDLIFLCDTYHHVSGRVEYIAKLGRALKSGGRVAIVDYHKRELPVGPPPEHKLAREQVISEFAEAGWVMTGERDLLPYQYVLIFAPR